MDQRGLVTGTLLLGRGDRGVGVPMGAEWPRRWGTRRGNLGTQLELFWCGARGVVEGLLDNGGVDGLVRFEELFIGAVPTLVLEELLRLVGTLLVPTGLTFLGLHNLGGRPLGMMVGVLSCL